MSQAGHMNVMKRKTIMYRTAPTVVIDNSAENAAVVIIVVMATWPLVNKNLWKKKGSKCL